MSTVDTNATAIDTVTEGIDKVAISDSNNNNDTSEVIQETCAACGKEGNSEDMNTCNKCKMVKYCNAACKKKHRSKHKKACEKRVAELHDEALFADPPPPEECPLCFLILPIDANQCTFESCCGKSICNGCMYTMKTSKGGIDLCAFCRTPPPTSKEENIERTTKLKEAGNAEAFNMIAGCFNQGIMGISQDRQKACELYLKAGELGCAAAYFNLGIAYDQRRGVEVDKKKAQYYWELSAMNGSVQARNNLGCLEGNAGNLHRAMKHFVMAAKAGHEKSLKSVKKGYENGDVTKDEYANTLRAYHERQKVMKSDDRDKAAASGWYSSG